MLGPGIDDPLARVVVWLTGCGAVSAVGALVGLLAMLVVAAVGVAAMVSAAGRR